MGVCRQASVVMLLVTALLVLRPLAEAGPPDQTWVAGFYDDSDHDDAVLFIMGVTAVIEDGAVDFSAPALICLERTMRFQRQPVPVPPSKAQSGRAPPRPFAS
jgi:hypothetical protein